MNRFLFLSIIVFVSFESQGQATVNTSLQSCSSTANTLDFDLFIENATSNSANNFILQSGAYGIDFNYHGIRNGGTVGIAYIPGTSHLLGTQANFNAGNTNINVNTSSIRINAQLVTMSSNGTPLPPGTQVRVGKFRLTNTVNWTTDSFPDFSWVLGSIPGKTRTQFTVYLGGSSLATGFVPTLNDVSLSSVCAPLILNSRWQYFSVAHQLDFSSVTNKIIKASDEKYFVIGAYGGSQTRRYPYIFCVNDSGSIVFDKNPFAGSAMENYDVTDILKTADGNFICIGHGALCDVAFAEAYAEKFDSSGATIWSKTFQFNSFYDSYHHLAELSNGNFAFVFRDKLFFINNLGDSLNTITLPNDSVNSLVATPDNYLLIGNKNGIEKRDLNGSLIYSLLFANGADNIIVEDTNNYVFNSSTMLYRTDSVFNTIDSSGLQTSVSKIHDIAVDSSGFQILGNQKIVHVNNVFDLDTTVLNIYSPLQVNDIIVDKGSLLLAGDETTNSVQTNSKHSVVKSYDVNYQTNPETNDAGVVDISSDSVNVYLNGIFMPTLKFNLYATVKNYGIDTIHDVAANFTITPPWVICNPYESTGFAQGVNLASQDTLTIYLGAFQLDYPLVSPAPISFCVWSSSPDKHIDINHSNDKLCKVFMPNYIVSIEENSPLSTLQISPNPASDNIQINIPELASTVGFSITDLTGKEVKYQTIDKEKTIVLLEELKPGMYFLKFNFANQQVVKKIIKQ